MNLFSRLQEIIQTKCIVWNEITGKWETTPPEPNTVNRDGLPGIRGGEGVRNIRKNIVCFQCGEQNCFP